MQIDIVNRQHLLKIDHEWYKQLAGYVCAVEAIPFESLSIVFVDNETIHELNAKFLQHDFPTDVITFPLNEPAAPIIGEIVVSIEYALSESLEYNWPAANEASLYVVHGILHLCGYDDHADADREIMKQRQSELLDAFISEHAAPLSESNTS